MKTPEILKIFTKHGFNEYNCPFFKSEDIVNIASEIEEAINYTHSCKMEEAFNDGVEAEQQRCGEFNIENYC